MKQEITVTAKTIEAAVNEGAEKLGVSSSAVTYEVIEAPKKGLLGSMISVRNGNRFSLSIILW